MMGEIHTYHTTYIEDKHGNTRVFACLPKKAWLTYEESSWNPKKTRRYRWVWLEYVWYRTECYIDGVGRFYYLEP